MRILLVLAHPLADSFSAAVAATAARALRVNGHEVDFLDLYAEGFDPRLGAGERRRYFDEPYEPEGIAPLIARLRAAEGMILVFPQWWFDVPAILKGFFDRVLAPGVAFHHAPDGGRIRPGLAHIRLFWALTTTGSPWWVVHLYMGNPVRRLLRRGIAVLMGRPLDFRMLSLNDMDRATPEKRASHLARIERTLRRI